MMAAMFPTLLAFAACAPPSEGREEPAAAGEPGPRWLSGLSPRAPSAWEPAQVEPSGEGEGEAPGDPRVTEETVDAWESPVFSETEVMEIDLLLSEAAVDALRSDPNTFVEGSVTVGDHTWSPVGVRLKGSASFQPIDAKSNWKIKFEDYTDERFYGLDRLTLQNNVWDASMMAQDLAYRFFREAGVPAPRTGYAWVRLNGTDKGLFTILESMDDQFIEREFPETEGNLYEMTRECDFSGDGSCYELQELGAGEPDPDNALASAVAAVDAATTDALKEAFDWEDFIGFLAVERVINHPDSYSFNLNNYFIYHNPTVDKVSLVPWGADSTFVYTYPPNVTDYACEASAYRDVLASGSYGWLGRFCETDPECSADLRAAMSEVAALLLSSDLAGYAEANRERIRPYMEADPLVVYEPEHFEARVDCFITWITERPDEIAAYLVE